MWHVVNFCLIYYWFWVVDELILPWFIYFSCFTTWRDHIVSLAQIAHSSKQLEFWVLSKHLAYGFLGSATLHGLQRYLGWLIDWFIGGLILKLCETDSLYNSILLIYVGLLVYLMTLTNIIFERLCPFFLNLTNFSLLLFPVPNVIYLLTFFYFTPYLSLQEDFWPNVGYLKLY